MKTLKVEAIYPMVLETFEEVAAHLSNRKLHIRVRATGMRRHRSYRAHYSSKIRQCSWFVQSGANLSSDLVTASQGSGEAGHLAELGHI
ncbi:hypothetical protein NKI46_27135 [Mesorhizobium sp. M0615]|uniref:hypothetical protein n=1 Tax=Mesorhizobium sp. M0615 TaxID=2956971 RepID=UPI00333524FB